jgi:uncharacterized protein YaaQ
MKLIIAIVHNDDSAAVSSALTRENFTVTKLSTTGGFLLVGNTTFLIGAEDNQVSRIKEIIHKFSHKRTIDNVATTNSYGKGLNKYGEPEKITVGGATVFVLSVDEMEKY